MYVYIDIVKHGVPVGNGLQQACETLNASVGQSNYKKISNFERTFSRCRRMGKCVSSRLSKKKITKAKINKNKQIDLKKYI